MTKHINLKKPYGSSKEKALTIREMDFLERNLEDTKNRIILIGLAYAGLRQGELYQCRKSWLHWQDTESGERILAVNIPNEDRNIKNKLQIWRPKTRRERTTFIMRQDLGKEFYNFFKENSKGIDIDPNMISMYRVKKQMGDMLERKNISGHALRASYVTYMKHVYGASPNFIAATYGHTDIRMTMKHYEGISRGNAEAEAHKLIMNKERW